MMDVQINTIYTMKIYEIQCNIVTKISWKQTYPLPKTLLEIMFLFRDGGIWCQVRVPLRATNLYTLETQNLEIIRICFDTRVLDRMFFENLQLPSKPGFSHQILDFRLSSTRSTLFVHRIWTKCSGTQPFLGSWSDGVQEALEKLMVSFLKHFGSSCFKVEL